MAGWRPKQAAGTDPDETVGPDAIGEPSDDRVTLIGRPKSGKSLLVGGLLLQAHNSLHSFQNINPMFMRFDSTGGARSPNRALINSMHEFVGGTSLPPTLPHATPDYHVRLICDGTAPRRRSLLSLGRRQDVPKRIADIIITDRAGGVIMGRETDNQEREDPKLASDFLQIVRGSRGLIFCLPLGPSDSSGGEALDKQIQVINDLALQGEIGLERLVVCFTKYESLFLRRGCLALEEAWSPEEFKRVAQARLPKGLRQSLVMLAGRRQGKGKRINVRLTPASTFGFVKGNGCVNYNPLTSRLLTELGEHASTHPRSNVKPPYYAEDAPYDYWQPFFIVDPFVYAAFGDEGDMMWDILDLEG